MAGTYVRDWAVCYVGRLFEDRPAETLWLQWAAKKKAAGKEKEGGKSGRRYLPAGTTGLVWLTEWEAKAAIEDGFGRTNGVRMVHRDDVPASALKRKKRAGRG